MGTSNPQTDTSLPVRQDMWRAGLQPEGLWWAQGQKSSWWDFPGGPVAKTALPMEGSLGSIPGQGTRSYMLQLRTGSQRNK